MRRIAFALSAIFVLGILAACGGGTSTTPGAATGDGSNSTSNAAAPIKEGGILRVGYTDPPDGINPFVGTNQVSYIIFQETYPALVQYDENFKLVGDWAESWTISPDGKVYTFKVKPGKWSDGTPLTAKDAEWTGNTVLKYADVSTGLMAGYINYATSFKAIDDSTLEITYSTAVSNALANLQPFYILPKHVFEQHLGNNGKELKQWDMKAEGELVGGFHTEYSSLKFALFFLAEYVNIIAVSALATTLFLGGYHALPGLGFTESWLGGWFTLIWFFLKVLFFFFIFVWLRGTLPRLRYDQFMQFGWKVLIPVSILWILVVATLRVLSMQGASRFVIMGFAVGLVIIVMAINILFENAKNKKKNSPVVESATPSFAVPELPTNVSSINVSQKGGDHA